VTARVVVAGIASGVGKTTFACALAAAFAARGRRVQPFKVGPDYIDSGYHTRAAGRASRNLDSFLLPHATLRAVFARAAARADVAVVEGVMGLFDGRSSADEEGSTAQVAKLIDAPVLVVIDVRAMARTAAALALGCVGMDPALRIAGFLLDRVGSDAHARSASEAIEAATGLPVLGALPRDDALALPERHLGLVPAVESAPDDAFFARLAMLAEGHAALDRIWRIAGDAPPLPREEAVPGPVAPASRARIAIARDEAFHFYYEDALEVLAASGAELVPFSPLGDRGLPDGVQGLYVGGGFPEMHAAALAANRPMRDALVRAVRDGMPVYAECGGLMYLGRSLEDLDGRRHEMVGVIPADSVMHRRRLTLGYRTVSSLRATPLLRAGETVRGHEFHWSELARPLAPDRAAYRVAERSDALEGYADGGVLGSYVHLHFAAHPAMARRFVESCARREALA